MIFQESLGDDYVFKSKGENERQPRLQFCKKEIRQIKSILFRTQSAHEV